MRFLALVVAALIATAHAQVTIEYWHINSATFGAQAVTQAIAAFQAEHPEVRVVERFQEGSYGGLLTNLQAAIAAGRPPAVAQIGYNFRLFAFDELPHVPVEAFSDRDDYAAFVDGFIPGMLRLGSDDAGVLRAVPFAVSVPLLYYNADLFREAGLDPDAPPATWSEVREAAKAIRDATGRFGIGIQISNSNNWVPQGLIESNGGEILDADGNVGVDRPEVIEVYEFWQALALEDGTLPVVTDAEQEQAFLAGQLGMSSAPPPRSPTTRRSRASTCARPCSPPGATSSAASPRAATRCSSSPATRPSSRRRSSSWRSS